MDPGFRKDANQVLMDDGAEALQACIDAAEPYPIRGLFRCAGASASANLPSPRPECSPVIRTINSFASGQSKHALKWVAGRFSDFWDEIKAYHGMQQTSDVAVSTGWKSVDEFYRVSWRTPAWLPEPTCFRSVTADVGSHLVAEMARYMQIVPGELTIITGVPNSGKSEWIDALLCNLTHQHGWSFALCSMEKKVRSLFSAALTQDLAPQSMQSVHARSFRHAGNRIHTSAGDGPRASAAGEAPGAALPECRLLWTRAPHEPAAGAAGLARVISLTLQSNLLLLCCTRTSNV